MWYCTENADRRSDRYISAWLAFLSRPCRFTLLCGRLMLAILQYLWDARDRGGGGVGGGGAGQGKRSEARSKGCES